MCHRVEAEKMIRHFCQYDEDGKILKTVLAKNIEWCNNVLGGKWVEVTDLVNANKEIAINIKTGQAYDPYPVSVVPEPIRQQRGYSVWLTLPADDQHLMFQACTTKNYMTLPPKMIWDNSFPLIENYIKVNPDQAFPDVVLHKIVIDSAPDFAIVLNIINSGAFNISREDMVTHPHIIAPTVHELLRMIYEWEWAYIELGSREPAAELCHKVWAVLNPPEDVIDIIKKLPDMAIARYISGDTNAAEPLPYDPPCPQEISLWWEEKLIEFSPANNDNFNDLGLVFTPLEEV